MISISYIIQSNFSLLYVYHLSRYRYYVMFPEWTLILNAVIGAIRIFIGLMMTCKKIRSGVVIVLIITGLGVFVEFWFTVH